MRGGGGILGAGLVFALAMGSAPRAQAEDALLVEMADFSLAPSSISV
jgi:hypothetical protein